MIFIGTADGNQISPHKVGGIRHAVNDTQDYPPFTGEDQSSMLDHVLVMVWYVPCLLLLFYTQVLISNLEGWSPFFGKYTPRSILDPHRKPEPQ